MISSTQWALSRFNQMTSKSTSRGCWLGIPWIFSVSGFMKTMSDFSTDKWSCHGFTVVTYDCQFLHWGLWGSGLQDHLLVLLCGWHIYDICSWTRTDERLLLTTSTTFIPTYSSWWGLRWMATFSSWTLTYREDQMALWDTGHTCSLPTQPVSEYWVTPPPSQQSFHAICLGTLR